MDSVEIILAMLLAVIASGYLVRSLPISIPLPLAQIALGAVLAGVFNHGVMLDPGVFFLLFLPPLLFLDGWRIPKNGLFRDKAIILELAFGLVIFTVVGAGFFIHWLIPSMPLPVAFALAAIVSPTDPIAVSSITSRVQMPKRLLHILEGESLLNDATGLVCFRFALAAAITGGFSLASASLTFLWVASAGIAIGAGVTAAISYAQRWASQRLGEESGSPILISLLIPFGAYLLAEQVHASGILAAVAAGVTMSYVELRGRALATTRVRRAVVWDMVQFTLNGIIFVLLGEQLPTIVRAAAGALDQSGHSSAWWLALYAFAITAGLALLRYIWVWASLRITVAIARRRGETVKKPHWRVVAAMSLAGVRGAITLAGVMTLPLAMPDGTPFPARELAIFLASAVILISLIVASIGLPRILRGLEVLEESAQDQEEDKARHNAALAAISAIEKAPQSIQYHVTDADVYTEAAARVIDLYQHRLINAASSNEPGELRKAEQAERELRLIALDAERNEIFHMARRGEISDEMSRKIVREIDLMEALYR
jgi:monovalent cation/hydrogen antiporter